jgi:putative Holliday junction resolvase
VTSRYLIMPVFGTLLLMLGALLPPTPRRSIGERTVGVDFGLRRVGIAISSGIAPLPLRVLPCGGCEPTDFEVVARAVARIADGEGASQVVVGMPYNSSGGEGEQAVVTRQFASILADVVAPRPVFLWDERFSSAEASMRMHAGRGAGPGEPIDAIAAAIILEDFFAADDDACAAAPHVQSEPRQRGRSEAAKSGRWR